MTPAGAIHAWNVGKQHKMVIVSNRLPVVVQDKGEGQWEVKSGSGGLVTALAPVLRDRGGTWIGWPGHVDKDSQGVDDLLRKHDEEIGYSLRPVMLDDEEVENYYKGFSNETLWPLFHDLIDHSQFKPEYWDAYQRVNRKFAEVVKSNIEPEDFIWIHDYHLISVISYLREMGVKNKVGFFLHIPFPPTDIYSRLPSRLEVLNAMLAYDLVGFQSARDRRNFVQSVRSLKDKPKIKGKGQVIGIQGEMGKLKAGVFPISIDYKEFNSAAQSAEVAQSSSVLRQLFPNQKIILGVDRLDYTKGIPERLRSFREALRRFPELIGQLSMIQILVPSRRDIHKYEDLKIEIERMIAEINGEFTRPGWLPIEYQFRSLDRKELLAYYRVADIMMVTPLKDGMNLVAKEYCACNIEGNGVLILSEFAGTAAQLKLGAILVNPHDTVECAEAIFMAFHMEEKDRKIKMQKLRRNVNRSDIFDWVDSFLKAAFSIGLGSFPLLADYRPLKEGREAVIRVESTGTL
ncbi:MAG: trehalose-6-phosphate synthase [Candidatus Marinimicrobia bacterium]|nr:trehalose-6-phosphate synthase [Candidatus Neomarinimicrobiota bacterium]